MTRRLKPSNEWVTQFPMATSKKLAKGARRAVWQARARANEVMHRAPVPGRIGRLLRVEWGFCHVRAVFEVIRQKGPRA